MFFVLRGLGSEVLHKRKGEIPDTSRMFSFSLSLSFLLLFHHRSRFLSLLASNSPARNPRRPPFPARDTALSRCVTNRDKSPCLVYLSRCCRVVGQLLRIHHNHRATSPYAELSTSLNLCSCPVTSDSNVPQFYRVSASFINSITYSRATHRENSISTELLVHRSYKIYNTC